MKEKLNENKYVESESKDSLGKTIAQVRPPSVNCIAIHA
jgi:hypothetical protein